jgi:hypothetical protein
MVGDLRNAKWRGVPHVSGVTVAGRGDERQSISSSEGVSRPPRQQAAQLSPPGERFRRRHNHAVALNSWSTPPRKASSTPDPTRTIEPPISISITDSPEPAQLFAMIEQTRMLRRQISNGCGTKLPSPIMELIAMQPVAQRDRTRHAPGTSSPRQSPPSPPRSRVALAEPGSKPRCDGNCARQLVNYLHATPCLDHRDSITPLPWPRARWVCPSLNA